MTFALTSEIICLARETNKWVANAKVARANLSLIALYASNLMRILLSKVSPVMQQDISVTSFSSHNC